jgi:phosphopentomutase
MKDGDVLFITADHGNDPTDNSTNHCREYVPLMAYGKPIAKNKNIGIRKSFADLGKTISAMLAIKLLPAGESFATEITEQIADHH